jgi:hypothetical protein
MLSLINCVSAIPISRLSNLDRAGTVGNRLAWVWSMWLIRWRSLRFAESIFGEMVLGSIDVDDYRSL